MNVKIVKVKGVEIKPMTEKQVEELKNSLGKIKISPVYNEINSDLVKTALDEKEPMNVVQPEFEGEYKLKIKGNRISLIKDGLYVSSKCHKDDVFNFGKGISNCFTKLFEEINKPIKAGDVVKVIDNKYAYTEYKTWIYEYLQFKDVIKFQYSKMPKNGLYGEVIAVNQHLKLPSHVLIAIKTSDDKVYLLDAEGVKKVR